MQDVGEAASPTSLDEWRSAWSGLDVARMPPDAVREAVLAAYAEPQRAYHTRQHLDECLHLLRSARSQCQHPDEVALALWFHDAVYQPQRADNEARSADWLCSAATAAGTSPAVVARLHRLVMATRHAATLAETDQQVLVDIDLAILGAPQARFQEYERQVRQEYAWVEESAYRRVRGEVLREFLSRPRLYSTAQFHERLEQSARANLSQSIAMLM